MEEIDFSRWTDDSTCKKIIENDYKEYLEQFDDEQKIVINKLFEKISFYDSRKADMICDEYCDFLDELAFNNNYSCFFSTYYDDAPHNSDVMFGHLKSLSRKYKNRFYRNYLAKDLKGDFLFSQTSTIVIIDDYSGSGNTIIEMLNFIDKNIVENKNVIVAPMIITDYAIETISSIQFMNLNIIIKSPNPVRKVKFISKQHIFNDSQLESFESMISSARLTEPYGHKMTEELLAFSYYTPNNTIGIIWEDSCFRSPFLNRDKNLFRKKEKVFFNHEYIKALKSCVRSYKWEIQKKAIMAIYILINLPKRQICTNLKIYSDDDYNAFLSEICNCGILSYNGATYIRGDNFDFFVDDEVFTRYVFLDQDYTLKNTIDNNFNISRN